MKSVFSSELISIICSTSFFMDLTLIVASLMFFDLFLHVLLLSFTWTRFLVLTLVCGIFLLRSSFLGCLLILYFWMISIVLKGKIQYLICFKFARHVEQLISSVYRYTLVNFMGCPMHTSGCFHWAILPLDCYNT